MKSKIIQQQQYKETQDDDIDIDSSGPKIASAKKGKMAIIAASSILITTVVYFFFFKTDAPPPPEKLEEVDAPAPTFAHSDTGKSPFEIDTSENKDKPVEIFDKPATPDIPALPDLPKDALPTAELTLPEAPKPVEPPLPVPVIPPPVQQPTPPVVQQPETPPIQAPVAAVEKPEDKTLDPRYAPIVVFSGGGPMPALGVGYKDNIMQLNQNPIDKLQKTKPGVTPTLITDRTHTIAQGKLLTAVLETAINTEVPGFVRAIVSRDIYGESGNEVLIPRGSRLFGAYSSRILRGQARVEIAWSRLIRSDGVDLSVSFNASDQFGRSGIPGEIDNKYGSIIATSLLTSILTVGGVLAAEKLMDNNVQATTTNNPTLGTSTTTTNASNQAILDVSRSIVDTTSQIVKNTLNTSPIIRIPQGTKITVVVNSDINIPALNKKK